MPFICDRRLFICGDREKPKHRIHWADGQGRYLDMATWRMVVSIICGVLGTALYYIGFHQMWKLLKQRLTQPKQQKWVKLFQIAYLTGTVCWGYVHAMFMNVR